MMTVALCIHLSFLCAKVQQIFDIRKHAGHFFSRISAIHYAIPAGHNSDGILFNSFLTCSLTPCSFVNLSHCHLVPLLTCPLVACSFLRPQTTQKEQVLHSVFHPLLPCFLPLTCSFLIQNLPQKGTSPCVYHLFSLPLHSI